MHRRLLILLLLVCAGSMAHAYPAAETADQVTERARQLYSEQGPRAALPEFERALELYRQEGNRLGEAIVLGLIGNCHKRFGDFPKALDHLNRALAMKRELGDRVEEGKTLSHLGLVYWEMGDYPRAIEQLTGSIAIARETGNKQLEGSALNNLSLVYDELGNYRKSLEQYHRVLELYRGTDFARGEGDTLGNIGGVYLLLGQYREAMRYYQQALAISERLNLKPSASQDLGNIALCHVGLGQVKEALHAFDRALVLAREAGLTKEEADWRKGRGSALVRTGQYTQALEEYRAALDAYERAGLKRELVEALQDLGSLHLFLGDVGSSESQFRKAIAVARELKHTRGVTHNLIALGQLEFRRSRYEQAAALFGEALTQARDAGDREAEARGSVQLALTLRTQGRLEEALAESRRALETARGTGARPFEAEALLALGEVERRREQWKDAQAHYASAAEMAEALGDPELSWRAAYGRGLSLEAAGQDEEAVAALKKAVTVIESVRGRLREERFRAGYIEDKYQVYLALVRLLLKLNRLDDAFSYSERLRSQSYLDLMYRGPTLAAGTGREDEEAELRERIRQLQRALEKEQLQAAPQQRSQAVELFSSELAAAERAYQELLDDLRSRHPDSAAARALALPATDEIQRALPPGTALIEYVTSDEAVAIFVVTRTGLRATSVPLGGSDLRAKVELLRELILRTQSRDWEKPAASLRQSLIQPLEDAGWLEGVNRLYLVPHRILHYLPFAALPSGNGAEPRFLVEDYRLAYLPSASALTFARGRAGNGRRLFSLAPAIARLRYARQEAQDIARFFPDGSLVVTGTRATESAFKRHAAEYEVLHLATHGHFNKFAPLLSGVELEAGGEDDGRLEVHEILGMRLKADLVTLSACETALGTGYFAEVPAGDDFVGLTRAFLFAGSPSVLATLWEVNDRSTSDLMRSFYRQIAHEDKAAALASGQREMRAGTRYRHPYYWAPFVLVGSME